MIEFLSGIWTRAVLGSKAALIIAAIVVFPAVYALSTLGVTASASVMVGSLHRAPIPSRP